jgi:hypothetical protein
VKIAMRIKISGGRGDLTEWPDPGVPFWVDDTEGAQLCAGGMAYPVAEEPHTEARAEPDPGLDPVTADAEIRVGGKPMVNAPKASWVDHAVSQGIGYDEAHAMTKADLINRLKGDA